MAPVDGAVTPQPSGGAAGADPTAMTQKVDVRGATKGSDTHKGAGGSWMNVSGITSGCRTCEQYMLVDEENTN